MNIQTKDTYQREDDLIFYTPKDLERILQFKSTKIQQLLKQQLCGGSFLLWLGLTGEKGLGK